jgi:hypothetical protein
MEGYIGDVKAQLRDVEAPSGSLEAQFGAKGVKDISVYF